MYGRYMRDMYMQKQGNSGARGTEKEEMGSMYTGDVMNGGGGYIKESNQDEESRCGML